MDQHLSVMITMVWFPAWPQVDEFTCEKEGEGGGEKEKQGGLECSTDWDGDAVMASRQGHTTPRSDNSVQFQVYWVENNTLQGHITPRSTVQFNFKFTG